jgi:hypothetical protein
MNEQTGGLIPIEVVRLKTPPKKGELRPTGLALYCTIDVVLLSHCPYGMLNYRNLNYMLFQACAEQCFLIGA